MDQSPIDDDPFFDAPGTFDAKQVKGILEHTTPLDEGGYPRQARLEDEDATVSYRMVAEEPGFFVRSDAEKLEPKDMNELLEGIIGVRSQEPKGFTADMVPPLPDFVERLKAVKIQRQPTSMSGPTMSEDLTATLDYLNNLNWDNAINDYWRDRYSQALLERAKQLLDTRHQLEQEEKISNEYLDQIRNLKTELSDVRNYYRVRSEQLGEMRERLMEKDQIIFDLREDRQKLEAALIDRIRKYGMESTNYEFLLDGIKEIGKVVAGLVAELTGEDEEQDAAIGEYPFNRRFDEQWKAPLDEMGGYRHDG